MNLKLVILYLYMFTFALTKVTNTDILASHLGNAFGVEIKPIKHNTPRVREKAVTLGDLNFNYTQIVPVDTLGDIGFILEADYDLGIGYTMPWFTEIENLVV